MIFFTCISHFFIMCDTYFNIFFSTFFLFTTFTFIHFLTTPTLSYWYYLDLIWSYMVISVQFRCSVVSDSLQHHGLQNARPHCPSPDPWVYSNSCALSPWCHPTISSSVVPFSNLQSFPTSESFQMSQFFSSDGQSIRVSASASVLPMNIQDWFPLGWTGWIAAVQKHQLFSAQLSFSLTLTSIHDYWNKYSFD